MEPTQAADPKLLAQYEGLVIKTSSMYAGVLKGMEFEDVCQVLRVKVWKSLIAWDPKNNPRTLARMRAGKPEKELRDAFVFGNVHNQVVDLLKRQREQALLIEDIAPANGGRKGAHAVGPRDKFEMRYMAAEAEEVFGEIEEDGPVIPNTLSDNERLVLACMYLGYSQPEAALRIGLDRRKVATAVRNIRKKMADWQPTPSEQPAAPLATAA